ncbi:MAG: orotate phosphoribosyltransferase [Nitrososphaeraceae archaeon]
MDLKIDEKRMRLREIIKERGIVIKDVTLSSNRKSHFYYDIKSIVSDPEGAALIGDLMLTEIRNIEPKTRSVGGLELGAIAIATTIVYSSNQLESKNRISSFFVRKSVKTYGLEKMIEGIVKEPVIIVDDVITTGKSVLDAKYALRNQEIYNINIMSVIDREAKENLLDENNIKFHSLFKHSEFADYIDSRLAKMK